MRYYYIIILIMLMLGNTVAFAQEGVCSFLRETARVEEDYNVGKVRMLDGCEQGVIILEDAHCNVNVQRKLIEIIEKLNGKIKGKFQGKLPLVLQEGGVYGYIDTGILKEGRDDVELKKFLDEKLNEGKVGAGEYLHARDGGFNFVGTENEKYYNENYKYFMAVAENREATQELLKDIGGKLDKLRELIFSDDLKSFYQSFYEEEETDNISEHLSRLRLLALQYSVDLKSFPVMSKYFENIKAFSTIDENRIEIELSNFNKANNTRYRIEDIPEALQIGASER